MSKLPTRVSVGAEEFVLKLARSWQQGAAEDRPWCIVALSRFGDAADVILSPSLRSADEVDEAMTDGFEPIDGPDARPIIDQLLMERKAISSGSALKT